MATKRRRFTAQFKTKVATEALRGERTIQAIAAKYQVHPNQVSGWKRQAQAGLEEVFAGATKRSQTIERSNQAWCADITYIPVQGGFFYLVAVMDWASRRVLAWRLSNTLDTCFCLEALADALEGCGIPEIFNTDQGSQFTSVAFTGMLEASGIRCSMDGRGRCLDNVFIERLWRSLKYEAVYLRELKDGFEAQRVIAQWLEFYNEERPHSALDGRTPGEVYRAGGALEEQVA